MALNEAIKEIEDEVEDEILLPWSLPTPRGSLGQPTAAEVVHPYFYSDVEFNEQCSYSTTLHAQSRPT